MVVNFPQIESGRGIPSPSSNQFIEIPLACHLGVENAPFTRRIMMSAAFVSEGVRPKKFPKAFLDRPSDLDRRQSSQCPIECRSVPYYSGYRTPFAGTGLATSHNLELAMLIQILDAMPSLTSDIWCINVQRKNGRRTEPD